MGAASRVAERPAPLLLMAAALAALSLTACNGRIGGPAPVVAYGASGSSSGRSAMPAVAARESTAGEIVVRSGDTLYAVSRRTNAPLRALIDANNLHPPYALQAGQHLTVPHVRSYRVQPGDTLAAVARRYGVETSELVQANALTPPYGLRTGQVLVLPGTSAPVTAVAAAPVQSSPAAPRPAGAVETASLPSVRTPTPVVVGAAAAPAPQVATPTATPSATPSLPRGVIVAAPSASEPQTLPPQPQTRPSSVPGPGLAALPMPPAAPPGVEPASLTRVEPPTAAPEEVAPGHPGHFLWPLHGTVVSDYGSKPGGLQNDGINIAAPRGTAIHAADAGVVVYAGNELRGFGNLLLLKHRGGWVTAYAHADELLVHRGDEVRRGQVVARVGSTGGVSSPQLHFEVRKGAHALNPRDYLGPLTASASP